MQVDSPTLVVSSLSEIPSLTAPETIKPSRRQRRAGKNRMKPLDAIQRADISHREKRNNKRSAPVKPAAKEPSKAKQKAPDNQTIASIKIAATALDMLAPCSEKFSAQGSFVVKLKSFREFFAALPKEGATAEAKAFLALNKTIAKVTGGDPRASWVFHRSGSFALYSKFAK